MHMYTHVYAWIPTNTYMQIDMHTHKYYIDLHIVSGKVYIWKKKRRWHYYNNILQINLNIYIVGPANAIVYP